MALTPSCVFDRELADDGGSDDSGGESPLDIGNVAERLAAAQCRASIQCLECEDVASPSSLEECVAMQTAHFEARIAAAVDLQLTFVPECAAVVLAYFDSVGCEQMTDAHRHAFAELTRCDMLVGTGKQGDACEPLSTDPNFPDLDPCAPGLRCFVDTCRAEAQVGESCDDSDAPLGTVICAEGTFCDPGLQCQMPAAIGEPCTGDPEGCTDGLYCQDDLCVPLVAPGEPCPLNPESIGCDGICGDDSTCVAVPSACAFRLLLQ